MAITDEKQKQPPLVSAGDEGVQPPVDPSTQNQSDLDLSQNTQMQQPVGTPETGMPEDMGMGYGGMGTGEDTRTPEELYVDVIRKYEMKKIYHRLHSIENFMYNNNTFDISVIKLQRQVSSAIELFDYVVENLKAYRKDIDNIIKTFNNLIDHIYSMLRDYSKKLKNKSNNITMTVKDKKE